jgi:UDP-N-acetyl-2-amino-2-deoxyglucuronate dehydrogenase
MIGFALLGCGQIATKHVTAIERYVPDGKVIAVCDPDRVRASHIGALANCPAFQSLEEMMTAMGDKIDVVNILTPTGRHLDSVTSVASYGKHAIVEKPLALSTTDSKWMIEACLRAGVRLFVVKQNRFNRVIRKLHEAVRAGRFQKIVMATVRVRWRRDQSYYDRDAWRGTRLLDGGVLANQASHHLDLLLWLVGDVETASAYTARQLVDIETEDTAVAILRFKNGALGVVEATTAARPKDLEASISILGEGGAVEIGGFATDEVRTWQFQQSLPEDDDIAAGLLRNPEDRSYAHGQYLQRVVAILNGEAAEAVDGEEGLRTIRLIEQLYQASAA